MKPLAIDLFCGLGGWTEGLLVEGWNVIGFDIERHDYGTGGYPAQLVLQDVLTLHGSQFKDAALIVASPPCQGYSYRAMPWSRAKALPPPDNSLFDACFRIQREAIEAAGHFIPLIVENVRGAQKWVGRARWNFGSFYLWGDVPALMPMRKTVKVGNHPGLEWSKYGTPGYVGRGFNEIARERATKGQNPNGTKVGKDWFGGYGGGFGWDCSPMRRNSSNSNARKAASAAIAKIPFVLASHIARTWKPEAPLVPRSRSA